MNKRCGFERSIGEGWPGVLEDGDGKGILQKVRSWVMNLIKVFNSDKIRIYSLEEISCIACCLMHYFILIY